MEFFLHDVWQHIFERCPSFQLRVLRRVCKTFYIWLSDDVTKKRYFELLSKERSSFYTLEDYISLRRKTENKILEHYFLKLPSQMVLFDPTNGRFGPGIYDAITDKCLSTRLQNGVV